ncbi:hypothetical protein TNCV_617191 [Trichonephila clavipes]|nr:hypothetical protein TNCV_617191 [Trichonephila clavipes]
MLGILDCVTGARTLFSRRQIESNGLLLSLRLQASQHVHCHRFRRDAYTCCFRYSHRKKSSVIRSGEAGGQFSMPSFPVWFFNSLTSSSDRSLVPIANNSVEVTGFTSPNGNRPVTPGKEPQSQVIGGRKTVVNVEVLIWGQF